MGNLSEFLPEESATVKAIYDSYVKEEEEKGVPRGYLGASELGKECDRYLWYKFRGCAPREIEVKPGDHPGRVLRLFQTGHHEEPRVIADLRRIGCEVVQHDGYGGDQIAFESLAGHMKGHLDGAVLGVPEAPKTWHVLEVKTYNDKNFQKLKKSGVKNTKPEHWAQCQIYMNGTNMTRCLYVAVNKNTDELYSERIKIDKVAVQNLLDRGARIIRTATPPERIADRPDDFRCRFCSVKSLCHGGLEPRLVPLPGITCRTCCHATADTENGGWRCEEFNCELEDTKVGADCPRHLLLPGLVSQYVPVDSGDGWIAMGVDSSGDSHWLLVSRDSNKDGWVGYTGESLMHDLGPLEEPPF